MKKRTIIAILTVALIVSAIAALGIGVMAEGLPFQSLFTKLFGGYTSDEGQILAPEYFSSETVSVSEGENVWFGPCDPTQYFQLVGQDSNGDAVTDKIRGKELTVVDTFANGMVIYRYTVPAGVSQLVFTAPASVADVYTIAKTEISELTWRAYWTQQGKDADSYVGESSYYEVVAGDKLYFGALTEAQAAQSPVYGSNGQSVGTISKDDLTLVESFGGEYGIYCYTVPEGISYTRVAYDIEREQYYHCVKNPASADDLAAQFVAQWDIPLPLASTIEKLSGKTALFLGDSITFGARDRANIYGVVDSVNKGAGGWAARIGYHVGMQVTNNGVSGACITTARQESHSEAHYIYNNLVKTNGTTYDYVIMHGLFNDASIPVELGETQGKANFDPEKADVTKFASALELLFYTARQQNPDAILGYIVNFHTDRAVDQGIYVAAAIKICEDWGIEYLDLYNRAGFKVEFDDGLHPSSAGYDSMYTIVANWMATLDGQLDKDEQTFTSAAKIMNYNVYWDLSDSNTGISGRAAKIAALIKQTDPDILMLQEAHNDWVNALSSNGLIGYSAYGYCHKHQHALGNCNDEMTPILWKTDKYDLVDSGCLHVDDGQYAEDGNSVYPRTINWVILKDKATAGQLLVMNYHAVPDKDGYNGEAARNATAQLIVQKLDALRAEHNGIPAVMGGDCNMSMTSTAYYAMVGNGLNDVRHNAAVSTEYGSYTAWERTDPAKYALGDYLFMSEGVGADSFQILSEEDKDADSGLHISDHSPLVTIVQY